MKVKTVIFLSLLFCCSFSQAKLPKVEPGKPLPSDIFIELNKTVNPAVVNISTKTEPKYFSRNGRRSQDPMEELLRQFFGGGSGGLQQRRPPVKPSHSLGTGFVIRKDGLILTNSHVVDQADVIDVQLSEKDEKTYTANVIGKDPKTDIALIKIKAPFDLPTVKLGDSEKLKVGEWVTAFGNPFGHGHTMTKGIVSAIGRNLDDINLLPFIQTDASINPGNSGGPLVNLKGEVIGVNTAIDARAQGIGFAIPINEVKSILKQLEQYGSVARGFLGVNMQSMNEELAKYLKTKQKTGALVVDVVKGSAASKGGLKPYDIITVFNGKKIKTSSDLAKQVSLAPINKPVSLSVVRNSAKKSLQVHLKSNQSVEPQRASNRRFKSRAKTSATLDRFGLEISNLTPSLKKDFDVPFSGKHKALITRVIGHSASSLAGLRPGDLIYEIDRKPIFSAEQATKSLAAKKPSFLVRAKRGDSFFLAKLEKAD